MLEIINLTKVFKDVIAVNDISFEVAPGKIFGLLGPNGAGKTTTIRIILNIIRPTSGYVKYYGINTNVNFANIVGYLPEERGLYKKSKIVDMLVYFAELKNIERIKAKKEAVKWLDRLGIADYANRKVEELSKGNQQKIQFIAAVIHNPQILILDEPFSGFDPINQQLVKQLIQEVLDEGKLILLSTHLMDFAEDLCTDIFLMNKGSKVLAGNLMEIKKTFGTNTYHVDFEGSPDVFNYMQEVKHAKIVANTAELKLHENVLPSDVLKKLVDLVLIHNFYAIEPRLNNIFIDSLKETPVLS